MSKTPDPLDEIRQLRAAQLRACALQQADAIQRLHEQARQTAARTQLSDTDVSPSGPDSRPS